MDFSDRAKIAISCILVGITSFICIKFYYLTLPNGWEVYIDSKPAAYVKNKEDFLNTKAAAEKEIAERLPEAKISSNISFEKVRVPENLIWSEKNIRTFVGNSFKNTDIEAFEVAIDGHVAAILGNNNEAELMINELKNDNASKLGLKSIKTCSIENNIKITKKKVKLNSVTDGKTAAQNIEANKDLISLFKFKVTGIKEITASVPPAVNIIWSDAMKGDQSVVKTQGNNGTKLISKQVTYINDKVVSEKVVNEKTTKNPVDKVIVKGKKDSAVASVLALGRPSRGAITSNFGKRWGRMHYGVDIAANAGTPIYAAMSGTVAVSGWESGYGNVVKINHGNGTQSIYGHCSKLFVKAGQSVKRGQKIGAVGSTGNSTGPHLHFEIRVNGKPINPISYLN